MTFTVKIENSNFIFEVDEDETILDAALRHDIPFPYSCYSGICTTCKGNVVSGAIDYGDNEIYGLEQDNPEREALFCSAYARSDLTITHPELVPAAEKPAKSVQCQIVERHELNDTVLQLLLKPQNNETFHFQPGQYVEIHYGGRQYPMSIACHPDDEFIELHLLSTDYAPLPEQLSIAVTQHDSATIHGPLGNAVLQDSTAPLLLVAGGTGIAPLKSIIQHVISTGSRRDMVLYWGARAPQYLYLHEQLQVWDQHIPNFQYIPVISDNTHDWQGRTGLVHQAVLEDIKSLSPYEIHVAGPYGMAMTTKEDFIKHSARADTMFSDMFGDSNDDEWE